MIEVVVPHTHIATHPSGNNRPWAMIVNGVKIDAKSAADFDGTFVTRGSLIDLEPGTIILEMAGALRKNGQRLYVLHLLNEYGEWEELVRSSENSWAKPIREEILEIMGDLDG